MKSQGNLIVMKNKKWGVAMMKAQKVRKKWNPSDKGLSKLPTKTKPLKE
jgi:hypothetical protein